MGLGRELTGTGVSSGASLTEPKLECVGVNVEACRRLARLLSSRAIPEAREDTSLPWMSPEQVGNFYLLLVAICYQTSPRGKPPLEGHVGERHLYGWDYLSAKLEAAARSNWAALSPAFWANIDAEQLRGLFRDRALGDRLGNPDHRALLVRDLGEQMICRSWTRAAQIYDTCEGRIATGSPNLLSSLANFRAYDDPVRKKSFFYLELMQNAGLWKYVDPENLGPPIDYHEVRGHLRIGTVEVLDCKLLAKIRRGAEVTPEEDVFIRQAVYKAVMLMSECSGLRNPGQLHYLFWNVFRSCCTRESPHCGACPSSCRLPDRYVPLALYSGDARRCPFSSICQSAGRDPKLMEHTIDTDYY